MRTLAIQRWRLLAAGAGLIGCASNTPWKELPTAPGYATVSTFDYQTAQFRKVGDVVCLRGHVRKGDDRPPMPARTVVALLPQGFRPPAAIGFATRGSDQSPHPDKIDINPDGSVLVRVPSAQAATFVILDGICFSTTYYHPGYS